MHAEGPFNFKKLPELSTSCVLLVYEIHKYVARQFPAFLFSTHAKEKASETGAKQAGVGTGR